MLTRTRNNTKTAIQAYLDRFSVCGYNKYKPHGFYTNLAKSNWA